MLRRCFAVWLLVGCFVVSLAPKAHAADSIKILENYTIRRTIERGQDEAPQTISLSDCLEDAPVEFSTNVSVSSGLRTLKVWIGPSSCLDDQVRNDKCSELHSQTVGSDNPIITLGSATIVGNDCKSGLASGTSASATLLFAFEANNGEPEKDGSDELVIQFDVIPPPPPNFTALGQGDGQLTPRWDPIEDQDVTGYRFFCEPSGTSANVVAAGGSGGGANTSLAAGGQAGAAPACDTTMVAGEWPPEGAFFCGEQAGAVAGRGTIKGVSNGQVYAVGVASRDLVGNEGVLSNILCQFPKEVTDFYEAYTFAGGRGGGGYCALGHGRGAFSWLGLGLLGLTTCWARRRRRRA